MPKPNLKVAPNRSADEEECGEIATQAMCSMRALVYEAGSPGSDDLVGQLMAQVSSALAELARQVSFPAATPHLKEAAKEIRAALARRHQGMNPNPRRPDDSRGLADDPVLLQAYVEMAAESAELDNWKDAEANDEVREVAAEYDAALKGALEELVQKYPPENGADADDLWNRNAPYLVMMTLREEGVGIWDGDWTDFYEDTDKAEEFLRKKLRKFADGTGAGTFEEACYNAAYQSCGEDPDEDDDDDGDD